MKSPGWSCVLQKASIAARWDIPVQPKKQRRRQGFKYKGICWQKKMLKIRI